MSIYIRPKVTGATVFFTVCLAHPGDDLLVREVERLRVAVRQTRQQHPFEILAWVTLPDRLHCIWRLPAGDRAFGMRWGRIKGRFTRAVRGAGVALPQTLPVVAQGRYAGQKPTLRQNRRECAVWQRRFWEHHIRNPADLEHHTRYCWNAPVREGLVKRPQDWAFSSIHRDTRLVA